MKLRFGVPGRLHLATPPTFLGERYGVITMDPSLRLWTPRYAIAPGQETLIVRGIEGVTTPAPVPRGMVGKPLAGQACELTTARWGLVSSWASTPDVGVSVTEASVETLDRRPVLWSLLSRRRCAVPVDGYYEWREVGKVKREPTWVGVVDPATRSTGPFLLAGVWDRWEAESGEGGAGAKGGGGVDTFAILTVAATGAVGEVHPRRPMILGLDGLAAWLGSSAEKVGGDAETNNAERVRSACEESQIPEMTWYAVSQLVNSPRHDDPRCLEPAARLALPGFGE